MKTIIPLLLMVFTTILSAEECPAPLPLASHMREMSFLVDHLYSIYESPERLNETIDQVQQIRSHLGFALNMTPSKLQKLAPAERNQQRSQFQEAITEMILLTLTLEKNLRLSTTDETQKLARKRAIGETLAEMNKKIGAGHERFRNRR